MSHSQRHWSFRPLKASDVPRVRNRRWPNNDLDRFILAPLEAAGLSPNCAVDKRTLLRRATFDLIGLPPAPEEIDAFLRDRSPEAFARVIDRLLASPHYGERWGRHWLDLVRYADSAGDSSDYPIPQAHKYRDYVIASFNQDKPYDQFLREQIAGDLLPGTNQTLNTEGIIATGFIALSRRFGVGGNDTSHLTIEDTLDTLGRAVLGLSLSCARCHDHKYDPISMQDYYGLYGIFSSTRYPHPGSEERKYQTNFVPLIPWPEVEARIRPFLDKLAVLDVGIARAEQQMTLLNKEGLSVDQLQAERGKLRKQRDQLAANPPLVDTAYAVADDQPADARLQKRGEPNSLGEEVRRGFPAILGGQQLPQAYPGSGRLELARWLSDPANPLTARVMINRIWQHHFGKGLVQTPSDFGTRGLPPTHPELLDYLALQFITSGWSVKTMHKLIMLSATYQQSSLAAGSSNPDHGLALPRLTTAGVGSAKSVDPNNDLLWKFSRYRLDAEQIRDALLAVSGQLDPSPGGPHPFPPASEWDFTQHKQFNAVYETNKRSVYLMQQRLKKHPFLALFDGADANSSTANRATSTTPLQALFAMNDPFAHAQAEKFAERLLRERGADRQRIDLAHQLAFGRPARPEDLRDGLAYLEQFRGKLDARGIQGERQTREAWSSYARALLGSNEFLFVD